MGFWSRVRTVFKRKPKSTTKSEPQVTQTSTSIPQKSIGGIRVTDTNKGAIITRGKDVWSGGGTTTVTVSRSTSGGGGSNNNPTYTVKSNNINYAGNTIVPNTQGKTASQLTLEGRQLAKAEGVESTSGYDVSYNFIEPNKNVISSRYSGSLSANDTQQILGERGFTNAYISQGRGTPTSPQAFKAAEAELNKPRSSTNNVTRSDVAPTTTFGKFG